jgi:PRTRC genetic system ThiF family protein
VRVVLHAVKRQSLLDPLWQERFQHFGGDAVQEYFDAAFDVRELGNDDDRNAINCLRQPFSESEVGLYKATVLATRINLFWGLDWEGVPEFMDEGWRSETDILIGCVDTRKSRRMITATGAYQNCHYWLDIGNNAHSGQFALGQPDNSKNQKLQFRLLTVAELYPEIVDPRAGREG